MSLRIRRGTDAQRQLITPDEGELIYTTNMQKLFIGDGATLGGINIGQTLAGTGLVFDTVTQTLQTTSQGGSGGLSSVSADLNPALGGNLNLNSHNITGTGTIGIIGTMYASQGLGGNLLLNGNNIVGANSTTLLTSAGVLSAVGGLGANLPLNGNSITGTGAINITGALSATSLGANLALGGYSINGSGNISITGALSATNLGANLALGSYAINGSGSINITGAITGTTLGGTLSTAAQPNVTSVGTLTSLTTSGTFTNNTATLSADTLTISGALPVLKVGTTSSVTNIIVTSRTDIPGMTVRGALSGSAGLTQNEPNYATYAYKGTAESPTILGVGDSAGAFNFQGYVNFGSYGAIPATLAQIGCIVNTVGDLVSAPATGTLQFSLTNGLNPSTVVTAKLTNTGVFTAPSLLASGTGGVGYGPSGAGTGNTVTQATSRGTPVTVNAPCGSITLFSTTTTAGQITTFAVSNNTVAATDVVVVSVKTATGLYFPSVTTVTANSFTVAIYTPNAVVAAEAPVLNFAVIKSVAN